jgi:class 3 adenylate cyclase/tetratricopeptide (TPR) repeat protein
VLEYALHVTTCPSCGVENRDDAKFCGDCGGPFASPCPSCGSANEPGRKFCFECGAALVPGAAPAPPEPQGAAVAPMAERRLVSVLFADLVGFTSLSESRDPEETRELLSRYFETSRRLIELYGGTVEKFIGDAVMAVWGTPTATEDDAERAVRAALDLIAAVSALGDEVGAPVLRARAGVLTGEAAVTIGTEGQGMVAGDLVNTASRIQSVAEPGSVVVGEATRRATEHSVVYEDAGAFELKGKEGLTPLWRALRVVSGVRGTLKSAGLEAPFVGRDRELRLVKELFHASADEHKPHLVSVTGIAGIGKSRLAWEFYKYFDGIVDTVYWHRGRCLAYGEGVTYWALADMVRMRCRIVEDEDETTAVRKLRATLDEHLLDPEERRFVEPRVAQLLGLGEHEVGDRQELFAAWRLFFERLADVYPTVLSFEDMQWADASLLDFVEYLLEWSRNSPIYVLTLSRPDLLERRPTWGAGHRNFTSLYLEPLSAEAMEQLLHGLVPGLPASLRAQILARAEGVPLYAVETVRMLLDRGLLVQEGSVYQPAGQIDELEVPETLHALIAARLDGLSSDERRLLQDAAVLGKTFTPGALAAVSGRDEADVEPLLVTLVRKEVLSLQADPRSPEHGQYGFLQDLVRHVAYETLSRHERKTRHLAAARHLSEALPEEEIAEVIASHLLEAVRAVPDADDAEEITARARVALIRAGERAASLAAASEAMRYFEQAAGLTETKLAEATLIDRAGQMAFRAGEEAHARTLLDAAHAAYEVADEVRAAALVSSRLAEIDFLEGHAQGAVARLRPALDQLAGGEPDEVVAAVTAQLGRFLVLSDHHALAVPVLEQALELAEAFRSPETLAEALNSKAIGLMRTDRLYEARVLLEAAVSLALEHDLHAAALRALNNLTVAHVSGDRMSDVLSTIWRGLELARRVGHRGWETNFLGFAVGALTETDRWDEALEHVAQIPERELSAHQRSFLLVLVRIHCERGDLEAAREVIASSGAVASSEALQDTASYAVAEARLLRAEGKVAEALAAAERVLATRAELGITFYDVKYGLAEALDAAFALGDLERQHGLLALLDGLLPGQLTPFFRAQRARFSARLGASDDEVASRFGEALRLFEELDMPFRRAVTELEHADYLIANGREAEAARLVAQSRTVFESMKAIPWTARTDEIERRLTPVPTIS